MTKIITLIRTYQATATIGEIYVDNKRVCYSLEDVKRPHGVKVPGQTCIPEGCYIATVARSARFQKDMIFIQSHNQGDKVVRDGITFSGIRVHKGNKVEDTEGCILVGESTNGYDLIYNCTHVEKFLRELVQKEGECLFVITSK